MLQDLEGRGERLEERRRVGADAGGDLVEVGDRDGDELREGSVGADDAHDRARGAVAPEPARARRADAAGEVDLRRDALALPRVGALHHLAEELVPEDAPEAHVAADDLQIGVADPGADHPHQRHAGGERGDRAIEDPSGRAVVDHGAHARRCGRALSRPQESFFRASTRCRAACSGAMTRG